MGMIVKMKPGSDRLLARLTIRGPVHWSYLLSSPDHTYKKSGISSAANEMDLGLPSDLQLDPHEWTIHLANLTSSNVNYDVTLEFLQAGTVLDIWADSDTLQPGDEAIPDEKAVLVIDPAAAAAGGV